MKERTIEETICPDADELRLIIDEEDKEDLGYYEANFWIVTGKQLSTHNLRFFKL